MSTKTTIKDALIRIDMICKRYGMEPVKVLFPNEDNSNFSLAINNLIFEIGKIAEDKIEIERMKLDDKKEVGMMGILMKILSAR